MAVFNFIQDQFIPEEMKEGETMKKTLILALFLLAMVFSFPLHALALGALKTEEVMYKQGETVLHGHLAYDDAVKGKRPGILVVHEWWGLNDYAKSRADALAKAGYIALALDMYGEGRHTEHPKEAGEWSGYIRQNFSIGKERFMAAYDLLRNHNLTDPERIAAIGYCFGGYVVLSMALEGIDLRAVVSFHGTLPLKRVEPKTVKASILVCQGADDPLIKPEQISEFEKNLEYARADWEFVTYGGAKHSFTNPQADSFGIPALGYNKIADRRSWKAMLDLFHEVFGTPE
jgi:dienelactone hydrolase